jgi:hypothetical protein
VISFEEALTRTVKLALGVLAGGLLSQATGSSSPWWWTFTLPVLMWLLAASAVYSFSKYFARQQKMRKL